MSAFCKTKKQFLPNNETGQTDRFMHRIFLETATLDWLHPSLRQAMSRKKTHALAGKIQWKSSSTEKKFEVQWSGFLPKMLNFRIFKQKKFNIEVIRLKCRPKSSKLRSKSLNLENVKSSIFFILEQKKVKKFGGFWPRRKKLEKFRWKWFNLN